MTIQNDNRCLNCQAILEGPYCGQCGQARTARLVPFRAWLGDFLDTFINLDSKLLRTLKRILLQPGQATLDFAEGRRAPYSGPLRLYIIVSAISIAAMTLRGVFEAGNGMMTPGTGVDTELQERVQFLFPFINLLSPFVTAGILSAFQRKQFFQLHLAFSLHLWTFMIAIGTPPIFIPTTSMLSLLAFAGVSLISVPYLFVAHRRVYPMPLLNRLAVCGAILFSVPLATTLFMVLLIMLASVPQ